jgi:hypothetical protein
MVSGSERVENALALRSTCAGPASAAAMPALDAAMPASAAAMPALDAAMPALAALAALHPS